MKPILRPTTGPDAALHYLITRNALPKLANPVPVLFGDARHGEALRRRRNHHNRP